MTKHPSAHNHNAVKTRVLACRVAQLSATDGNLFHPNRGTLCRAISHEIGRRAIRARECREARMLPTDPASCEG